MIQLAVSVLEKLSHFTHLLRAFCVMQRCLWPTHRRCYWLCPLSGRMMDQRSTGTASWLPTHNQISRTACHRWKSKWVILHKLAILHPSGNKKKFYFNICESVNKTARWNWNDCFVLMHLSLNI